MKLTHHQDGTYSLSGMSIADLDDIRLAIGELYVSDDMRSRGRRGWPNMTAEDFAYFAARAAIHNARAEALREAMAFGTQATFLQRGRSVQLPPRTPQLSEHLSKKGGA